jgi:hypothetical protein
LFPPHVRTPGAALDYLSTWCDIVGGELLDGIEWDEIVDDEGRLAVVRVSPFRIGFGVGTVLATCLPTSLAATARTACSEPAPRSVD